MRYVALFAVALALALAGCSDNDPVGLAGPPDGSMRRPDIGPPDTGPRDDATLIHMPDDGLPCDVANVLGEHCTLCHTNPPTGGAIMPLLTYDDLMAHLPDAPMITAAEFAVMRMQSVPAPMPPSPCGQMAPTAKNLLATATPKAPEGSRAMMDQVMARDEITEGRPCPDELSRDARRG